MHIEYLKNMLLFKSITPYSAGSIEYIANILSELGFYCDIQIFGKGRNSVTNLYAYIENDTNLPHICFAGHVDVVPPGDIKSWSYDPFTLTINDELIYGRGVVDMKGAIACFMAAAKKYLSLSNHQQKINISFLITSDEEGIAINGTKKMLEYIYKKYNPKINLTILGEPTSNNQFADIITIGRRGSVNFDLMICGTQGHVAYPEQANNPIKAMVSLLNQLTILEFDSGSEFFGKSNLEITTIDVDNNVTNIIPKFIKAKFNIRFNNLHTSESIIKIIKNHVNEYCKKFNVDFDIKYAISGSSFIQNKNIFVEKFAKIVYDVTSVKPEFSATGGISDARFIKDYSPVLEFGLNYNTAHKIDEHAKICDLQQLYEVYYQFLLQCF